jgi:hypothetical protein
MSASHTARALGVISAVMTALVTSCSSGNGQTGNSDSAPTSDSAADVQVSTDSGVHEASVAADTLFGSDTETILDTGAPNDGPQDSGVDSATVDATFSSHYFVSPTGSGNACSSAAPCSLTQAQTLVRAAAATMQTDILVELADGTLYAHRPIGFHRSRLGYQWSLNRLASCNGGAPDPVRRSKSDGMDPE